jgi:hypothetical protein
MHIVSMPGALTKLMKLVMNTSLMQELVVFDVNCLLIKHTASM